MASVDELRQAAETLRARARMTSDGPWSAKQNWIDFGVPDNSKTLRDVRGVDLGDIYLRSSREDNAAYIATMHPGVGLALADVLDEMGRRVDDLNDASSRPLSEETLDMNLATYSETLTLAQLINGGAA